MKVQLLEEPKRRAEWDGRLSAGSSHVQGRECLQGGTAQAGKGWAEAPYVTGKLTSGEGTSHTAGCGWQGVWVTFRCPYPGFQRGPADGELLGGEGDKEEEKAHTCVPTNPPLHSACLLGSAPSHLPWH